MANNATGAAGRGESISLSGLPFTFNPPIHPSLTHVYPGPIADSSTDYRSTMERIYDEKATSYGVEAPGKEFGALRLGRIVMGKDAMSYALKEAGTRYGFRFLYNPTVMQGGTSVNTDWIPDPTNTVTAVLQEHLEVFNFELLLDRTPEVMGGAKVSDYATPMSRYDLDQLRTRGTHYDVEFLYRVCNGVHNTKARSGTGDIGILLPNPSELFLGPYRSRGAVKEISVSDRMFSQDMVPVMTYVNISFMRFLTMADNGIGGDGVNSRLARDGTGGSQDIAIIRSRIQISSEANSFLQTLAQGFIQGSLASLFGVLNGSDATGIGGGATTAPPSNNGSKLNGRQVNDLALGAGFTASDARTMTQIAWGESGWNPRAHNPNSSTGDNSYGLWQINMLGSMGPSRRKALGLTSNEQLYDPATNARAARMIWKSQGFNAWSVYRSKKYRSAPSW
jgi:Lysozyme like domain